MGGIAGRGMEHRPVVSDGRARTVICLGPLDQFADRQDRAMEHHHGLLLVRAIPAPASFKGTYWLRGLC